MYLSLSIYIYIHTYTYICTYTFVYTYLNVCIHICTHTHMCISLACHHDRLSDTRPRCSWRSTATTPGASPAPANTM